MSESVVHIVTIALQMTDSNFITEVLGSLCDLWSTVSVYHIEIFS